MTTPKKTTQKKNLLKLPELNYNVRRFSDYQMITNNRKTKMFVFMNLVNAVDQGVKAGTDKVDLFRMRGMKSSILLEKSSWKDSLTNALHFFTEIEAYETCSKCKELIDKI